MRGGAAALCFLLLASGCAGSGRPPAHAAPPAAVRGDDPAERVGSYRLLIEPPEDESGSREAGLGVLSDIRDDIKNSLDASDLLESTTIDPTEAHDLALRPVILLRRVTDREPSPIVELVMSFELRERGSSAILWAREYSETGQPDPSFQTVSRDRMLMLATRRAYGRIFDSLRLDLAKLLLGY